MALGSRRQEMTRLDEEFYSFEKAMKETEEEEEDEFN